MLTNWAVIEGPCDECGQVACLSNLYPLENPEQVWLCEHCEQLILEDARSVEESSRASTDDFA